MEDKAQGQADLEIFFSSIRTPKTHQRVEEQIKSAILNGYYKPGDKIPSERRLTEIFKTSRSSIREALGSLENGGLVTKKTGKYGGTYVNSSNPTPLINGFVDMLQLGQASLDEIRKARLVFEPSIAFEAARNGTQEDFENLILINQAHAKNLLTEPYGTYHDQKLHIAIAEITKNSVFILIMNVLTKIHANLTKHIQMDHSFKKSLISQHSDIIKQITNKKPRLAFEAMQRHIRLIQDELSRIEKETLNP